MPTREEFRQALGPHISEKELDQFIIDLRAFLRQFLDEHFPIPSIEN